MVTAGATANTTEGNSRASRESGLLYSHSHGKSIAPQVRNHVERSFSPAAFGQTIIIYDHYYVHDQYLNPYHDYYYSI